MLRLVVFIWCTFLVQSGYARHTEEEAQWMVRNNLVQTDLLIIKQKDSVSSDGVPSASFEAIVQQKIERLFVKEPQIYRQEREDLERKLNQTLGHLENYFMVRFQKPQSSKSAQSILQNLYDEDSVEFAYFEPKTSNAVFQEEALFHEQAKYIRAETPNFETRQFHLEAAPRGVDARFGWEIPGGTGDGIRVIDVEFGWNTEHEDFNRPFFAAPGNQFRDHGTAVWGEVAAKRDTKGVSGIAYAVDFGIAASNVPAQAYELAASNLNSGDLIIIEQHQGGPDGGNYTAMEYWQANFDILKIITSKGIHVIAAAGNGNSNFDSPVYQGAFDLNKRDSGCVLVGAGGPPGTASHLQRLAFSNYGSRIDAFGYGGSVVTTGYGGLFNGGTNRTYTASFSGTSSATPIVTGAVAAVLGMAKRQRQMITPIDMRKMLRATGTEQLGDRTKRIGNLPDIRQLHESLAAEKRILQKRIEGRVFLAFAARLGFLQTVH